MVFTIKYRGFRFQFSHHPILWMISWQRYPPMFHWIAGEASGIFQGSEWCKGMETNEHRDTIVMTCYSNWFPLAIDWELIPPGLSFASPIPTDLSKTGGFNQQNWWFWLRIILNQEFWEFYSTRMEIYQTNQRGIVYIYIYKLYINILYYIKLYYIKLYNIILILY